MTSRDWVTVRNMLSVLFVMSALLTIVSGIFWATRISTALDFILLGIVLVGFGICALIANFRFEQTKREEDEQSGGRDTGRSQCERRDRGL